MLRAYAPSVRHAVAVWVFHAALVSCGTGRFPLIATSDTPAYGSENPVPGTAI